VILAKTVAHETNATAIVIFVLLFGAVTVLGFFAARWRRGDMTLLNEWGLGGRTFGTVVTWFLLGGDIYTAYTFIAVPALVFGTGGGGLFALPYTVLLYPIAFLWAARLWSVCSKHGFVTAADFVRARFGSRGLSLAVAFTGLLATMPYVALQLVGIQVVLQALGITGDWPLIIAFAILAAYTYQSGLRAPALIAFVKDLLIYVTVLVAVIYIPSKLGGYGHIFDVAEKVIPTKSKPDAPAAFIPQVTAAQTAYSTLIVGSALALFLYPHAITGMLSSRSAQTVRRNMALLPAYTFLLGLIALLGYMTIAAGIEPSDPNFAVPDLFIDMFPSWFVGVAFAAIAIGALVPAAVMSIASANLFTRNVLKEFFRPNMTDAQEAKAAKIVSLVVKVGAVLFVLFLPTEYAIDLQLLGGVWIVQTLPSVILGLYTRWLHRWALLAGWFAGMLTGTLMGASLSFKKAVYDLNFLGIHINGYEAFFGLVVNLVVAVVGSLILNAIGRRQTEDIDSTRPEDYEILAEEPRRPQPELAPG
jgi:solute:Na+ symporter, SSS family